MKQIKTLNKMKKIIMLLFAFTMISCADYATNTKDNKSPQRIHGKEYTIFCGYEYLILEVDGVEYIATTHGGITPLVKQPQ